MKFTDGYWRTKPGFSVFNAQRVYDYEVDADSILAYAPYHDIQNRGQTLEGPLLSYRLSSPMRNVIRVQVWHYKGQQRKGPRFAIREEAGWKGVIERTEDAVILRSGDLSARLSTGPSWNLEFSHGERPLTNSRWRNSGYVLAEGGDGENGTAYLKEELALGVGECVYGLGERFTPFVKNGQVVDSWNADGGTSSELSYKNVPFYLSNRGYGVLVNDCGLVSFEVGSEKVERVQFSVRDEYLEYFVIDGPDPKGVLERLTALTGRPGLPPAWSFGLWLTTSFITEYDEKTVSGFVDGMAERGIPLSVFHFDCFWMREYHWTDFAWNERYFPDPRGFLKRLRERGLRICVWINPYIAQRSRLFDEGAAKGYLLKRKDGSIWQADTWQPGMGIVDFTNPEAREWFASHVRRLAEEGVDSIKTDFGERIPVEDVAWHDGSDPERMHNYYSHVYNETVHRALEEKLGEGNTLVFARAGTAGGQAFPVHWGGDCTASYESMAESLRGGLSLCLSGYGFWSHDISGFEHTATPDLYKRWAAFGLLSTHSRLHGNSSYRVPWLFDEEAVDVLRFFTKLKCRLMPYLYSEAAETARTGCPVMRAMVLEFPDDPACAYLDRQYMLGDDLLVAPVFSATGDVEYYLPGGSWTDWFSGERVAGGRWIRERRDYFSLPLYAREGALIALGAEEGRADYDYAEGAALKLFGLAEGRESSAELLSREGKTELVVKILRTGGRLRVTAEGAGKPWTLELAGMDVRAAAGMSVKKTDGGTILSPLKFTGAYEVELVGS